MQVIIWCKPSGDDGDTKEDKCSSLVNPVTNRQTNCYHRVKQ